MLFAQAATVEEVAKVGGLSIVESGIIGSLLMLSVAINVALIRLLLKAQDKRVTDREADTVRLENVNVRMERMASTTSQALESTTKAVEGLEQLAASTNTALQGMQNSLDSVVSQALTTIQGVAARRSRHSPPDGTPSVRGG